MSKKQSNPPPPKGVRPKAPSGPPQLAKKESLICTNCGHGRNILDVSNWTGGPR